VVVGPWGYFHFLQGLKAQDLEVITGPQMILDRRMSLLLDPKEKYKSIWNRYAHTVQRSDLGSVSSVYELLYP
jgi:hypothetical protein